MIELSQALSLVDKLRQELYIGLMTGTSADGIDTVLVDCNQHPPAIIHSLLRPYPDRLRSRIIKASNSLSINLDDFYQLDRLIAIEFANACKSLLQETPYDSNDIIAIGCHGQTIRHQPEKPYQYTVQIGDPNTLCARTNIDVIADFRRADMASCGQGAPLAPLFHENIFAKTSKNTVILNLGGIANITLFTKNQKTTGFDTGPANSLLDLWVYKILEQQYDHNGQWAASGDVNQTLLNDMLSDPYFSKPAPKSTGREYFGSAWLDQHLHKKYLKNEDIQATLCELSASSIANEIKTHQQHTDEILLCGGGYRNTELIRRIKAHFPQTVITDTGKKGMDPDYLEAAIFAWLAKQYLDNKPGNLPAVTGSSKEVICGAHYKAVQNLL